MKSDEISDREEHRRVRQGAMSVISFSENYGIGRTKAYEELNSGRLRGRKIGTRTLISEADAEAWFQCLPARAVGKATT
jgi:hypothetical protein